MPASTRPPLKLSSTDVAALWLLFDDDPSKATMAVTIAMRESSGKVHAYRSASQNPDGGEDRGLWQINSDAWPEATDAIAYDPVLATEFAYNIISRKGTYWDHWKFSGPLVPNPIYAADVIAAKTFGERANAELNAKLKANGYTTIVEWFGKKVDEKLNAPDPLQGVLEPIEQIAQFFQELGKRIFNVRFWKVVGLALLGILIVIIGVTFFAKTEVSS